MESSFKEPWLLMLEGICESHPSSRGGFNCVFEDRG